MGAITTRLNADRRKRRVPCLVLLNLLNECCKLDLSIVGV